jgi:predicted DNA-binding transcriptional regulator AlpA
MTNHSFISLTTAAKRTSLSRSTLRNYSKQGKFPPLIAITEKRLGFLLADVEQWIDSRLSQNTERTA